MSVPPNASSRGIILALAALIIIWGLLGLADLRNTPYGGFSWGGANDEVMRIDEGGPADQAGMQVGDRIISVGGVEADDLKALRRQPREEIGETRPFLVERADAATGETTTETLSVTFTAEPTSDVVGWLVGAVIGLVFLLCGILVYFRVPSPVTLLFCVVGLGFGAAMFPGPYISAFGLRMFMEVVVLVFLLAGFAALLHFLLVFPKRKKMLEKAGRARLVYLPAALAVLWVIVFQIFEPETDGLNMALGYFIGILFIGYLVLAVVAMIHSFSKATSEERIEFGLNLVLWSIIVGLIPITLLILFGVIAPRISLPGEDYYFFTMVLIPVAFALALLKSGKAPAVVL